MHAKILDGKAIAADTRQQIKAKVEQRLANGLRAPGLAVVLVGDNPASQIYVRSKRRACEETGIHSEQRELPSDVTQDQLIELIDELNDKEHIDGILVQLPLPAQSMRKP